MSVRPIRVQSMSPVRPAVLAARNSAEGIRIRFIDSNPAKLAGTGPLPGVTNYFNGSAQAITNIPTYKRVRQHDLYPGIDAVYHGEDGFFEYDFVIAPGADPTRILLAFDGARSPRLNSSGEIELATASGTLTQRKPILYQDRDGQRVLIDGNYESRGKGQSRSWLGNTIAPNRSLSIRRWSLPPARPRKTGY